jgi:hypothetical protein
LPPPDAPLPFLPRVLRLCQFHFFRRCVERRRELSVGWFRQPADYRSCRRAISIRRSCLVLILA